MPKHAKSSDGPPAVLANCCCGLVVDETGEFVTGRRDWHWHCPIHGVRARVEAGIWPQKLADLWFKVRAEQPVK